MTTTVSKLLVGLAVVAVCWLCHPDRYCGSADFDFEAWKSGGTWPAQPEVAVVLARPELDPPATPRDGHEALGALEMIRRRRGGTVTEGVVRALEADPETRELGRALLAGNRSVPGWQLQPPESELGRLIEYLSSWEGSYQVPSAEELDIIERITPRALLATEEKRAAALDAYLAARGATLLDRMRAVGTGHSLVRYAYAVVTTVQNRSRWPEPGLPRAPDLTRLDELERQLRNLRSPVRWIAPMWTWGRGGGGGGVGPAVLEDFEPILTPHERLELALGVAGRLVPAALVVLLALTLVRRRGGLEPAPHGRVWHWLPPALGAGVLVAAALAPGTHGDWDVFQFLLPAALLIVLGIATWARASGAARWAERGQRRWQLGGVLLVVGLAALAATLWSRGGGMAWRLASWHGYSFIGEATILWGILGGLAAVLLARGVGAPVAELRGRVMRVVLVVVVILTLTVGAIGVRSVTSAKPSPREAALIYLAALVAGVLLTRVTFLRRLGTARAHVPFGLVICGAVAIALWILDPRDTRNSGELIVCSMDVALLLFGTLWLGDLLRAATKPPAREDPGMADRAHALLAVLADGVLIAAALSCLWVYQLNAAHARVEEALAALEGR